MSKDVFLILGCVLMASCNTAPKKNCLEGIVTDATMNTVTIVATGDDTLSFSTANADKTELDGLLIGDSVKVDFTGKYKSGMELTSLSTISKSKVSEDKCIYLFRNGIRVEAIDGSGQSVYILFSQDSLKAELYTSDNRTKEVLEQRTLPSGEHVWNIEDDNTKNLRYMNDCWTLSQRGRLLFKQVQSDNDNSLGDWEELHYEGMLPAADCPGIKYQLYIRHRVHSGNGNFLLYLTYLEAENGKDRTYTYMGKRNTLRGTPTDENATVWQLVSDNKEEVYNFLCDKENQTLTLINNNFEKSQSELNYSLNRIK